MTAAEILAAVRKILRKGFGLLADEIGPDLEAAFRARGIEIAAKLKVGVSLRGVIDREAVKYARARGAEMVKDFAETTPEMLRATIGDAIEQGWSVGRLRDELRESYSFSPGRALTIARTETARARRAGGLASARAAGAESKHWQVASDDACAACLNNQAAGWIGIDDEFPEGDDPHPNCTCSVDSRTEPGEDDPGGEAEDEAS